jgi:sigma54-dependent transcription regulator
LLRSVFTANPISVASWGGPYDSAPESDLQQLLNEKELNALDLFDRAQLELVVGVCGRSRSRSEAGRALFSASRQRKTLSNDVDRLQKYLARFGVEFSRINRARHTMPGNPLDGDLALLSIFGH